MLSQHSWIDKFPTLITTTSRAGRDGDSEWIEENLERTFKLTARKMAAEIRDSAAILRVGLHKDLEKSLDLVAGAGGQLENIHEALQVLWFSKFLRTLMDGH